MHHTARRTNERDIIAAAKAAMHARAFDQAIALLVEGTDSADANALLGACQLQTQSFAASLISLDRALHLRPAFPEAWANRAVALRAMGRLDEALASCDAALRQKPDFASARANRGVILEARGCYGQALDCFDAVLAEHPGACSIWLNRGVVLRHLGRLEEALASADKAIALQPVYPEAWTNRGVVLRELDRLAEAVESFETALAQKPFNPETWSNHGCALYELGRLDEAATSFAKALAQKPDDPDTRFHRGMLRLQQGDWKPGWADYECRWSRRNPEPSLIHGPWPKWAGESLDGKTLVVHSEQGFGDSFQFVRYLPLLKGFNRRVVFVTPAKMHAVLSGALDGIEVRSDFPGHEKADFHCPLMSLPGILETIPETIPTSPYLAADPRRAAYWRDRLGPQGFRIGIVWHGNRQGRADRRAVPLETFAPLARLPGVRLISLQKTHGLDQLADLPCGMKVETFDGFDDGADAFLDTAAVMPSLDLVIGSDTSVIHLAAALDRPVFVALRHVAEWRWLVGSDTSPWYPSMRLFRQSRDGDWEAVFERIAAAAAVLSAAGTS